MTAYRDMSREELLELKSRLEKEFEVCSSDLAFFQNIAAQLQ